MPSIFIEPLDTSKNLGIKLTSVDFPPPEFPTNATVSPFLTVKLIFFNIFSGLSLYLKSTFSKFISFKKFSNFIQFGLFTIFGISSRISETLVIEDRFTLIALNLVIALFAGVYIDEIAPIIVIKSPGVKFFALKTRYPLNINKSAIII